MVDRYQQFYRTILLLERFRSLPGSAFPRVSPSDELGCLLLEVHVRVLLDFYRHRAREHGIRDSGIGTLTVIQRQSSGRGFQVALHMSWTAGAEGGTRTTFRTQIPGCGLSSQHPR